MNGACRTAYHRGSDRISEKWCGSRESGFEPCFALLSWLARATASFHQDRTSHASAPMAFRESVLPFRRCKANCRPEQTRATRSLQISINVKSCSILSNCAQQSPVARVTDIRFSEYPMNSGREAQKGTKRTGDFPVCTYAADKEESFLITTEQAD